MRTVTVLATALVLLLCVDAVHSLKYNWDGLKLGERQYAWVRAAQYEKDDAPKNVWDYTPYITNKFNISATKSRLGGAEILVYRYSFNDKIGTFGAAGVAHDGRLCCTPKYFAKHPENCPFGLNRVIIKDRERTLAGISYQYIPFSGPRSQALDNPYSYSSNTLFTGTWYTLIANCYDSGTADTNVEFKITHGRTHYLNPFGWLSGELYPMLAFYIVLTFLWVIVLTVWTVSGGVCFRNTHALQFLIGATIYLSLADAIVWLCVYATLNFEGGINAVGPVVASIIDITKSTCAHLSVLLVAMGWHMYRNTLGHTLTKLYLAVIFVLYWITGLVANVFLNVQDLNGSYIPDGAVLFFLIPFIGLEIIIIVAIEWALLWSIKVTKDNKVTELYNMYRVLIVVIAFVALIALCIAIAQLIILGEGAQDRTWRSDWLFTVFYQVLWIVIFLSVVVVWRPKWDNDTYSYAQLAQRHGPRIAAELAEKKAAYDAQRAAAAPPAASASTADEVPA